MIVLAGADIVLADRSLRRGSLIVAGDRIAAIEPRVIDTPAGATRVDVTGCVIAPGFIDVHVHGVEGHDVLDGAAAVLAVAARLPRYGVTGFCPTSIACDPGTLATMLGAIAGARATAPRAAARVLPAHLESNFINPDYKGAQPEECLRSPAGLARQAPPRVSAGEDGRHAATSAFTGRAVLDTIAAMRAAVGIVTVAPELEGGLDLVRQLASAGHVVSIGHTGATYEQASAAIDAGVRHATHLFNRMSPMTHRAPGVPGAVLQSGRVVAELICDGFHVHPALMQLAIRAKGTDGIMAVTDGTAGSGLPVGSRTQLGGRPIVVTGRTAELEDGTLAGSVLTMDGAFRSLVTQLGLSLVDAARLCSTTPARQLRLADVGRLEVGLAADLVVLDDRLRVRDTYVAGTRWRNPASGPLV
jgi:N-acetylglucosamine-6-phosphate deacetylase